MTPRRTRPVRGAAAAAFLALLVLLGCGDEERQVEVAGPELMELGADQVMVGLTHNMTREGVLQGELRADTAFIFSDNSTVRLRVVDVTFYDDAGRPDSRLTADSGRYNLRTGDMEAHGNVVVRDTADEQRLETPQLIYEALGNELRTDTSFVWTRGEEVVRGRGLTTDPSFSDVRIEQPAGQRPTRSAPAAAPTPGAGAPDTASASSPGDTAGGPPPPDTAGRPPPADTASRGAEGDSPRDG